MSHNLLCLLAFTHVQITHCVLKIAMKSHMCVFTLLGRWRSGDEQGVCER